MIPKPCLDCGKVTSGPSRCPRHAAEHERKRQARQPYRAAYFTSERRAAKRKVMARDQGRCHALVGPDAICGAPATEIHEIRPLSSAATVGEAIMLGSDPDNMVAVCHEHQPRGQHQGRPRREVAPPVAEADGFIVPTIG